MDTLQTLFSHRTIRNYKSDPIDDAVLNEILEAGSRASTTGNMQVYSIIITKDEERKKKLWEMHFRQGMILQAPVILTFCCDFRRFNIWCENRDAEPGYDNFLSFFTGAIDALLAAQNVCIAAEDKGLGICYLGTTTYMADKIIEFLNLPEGVVPVTTVVLGYPAEIPGLTDRLPMKGIIHEEIYTDYTTESINEIYHEKENLPQTLKLLEENQLATLAQIFTEKRYTRKDNVHFSKILLDVLERQGFMNHTS
jgi:nitroreductase